MLQARISHRLHKRVCWGSSLSPISFPSHTPPPGSARDLASLLPTGTVVSPGVRETGDLSQAAGTGLLTPWGCGGTTGIE